MTNIVRNFMKLYAHSVNFMLFYGFNLKYEYFLLFYYMTSDWSGYTVTRSTSIP